MTNDSDFGANEHLRLVVDHIPSMLAYWDRDLICQFANRACKSWFGVEPDRLLGTSLQALLGPELFAANEPHITGALAGERHVFECVLPRPGGVRRHGLTECIPDRVGSVVRGVVVQVTDVTPMKVIQADLRWQSQLRMKTESHAAKLQALLQERTDMLDVMAHEVRQPLNNAAASLQSAAQVLDEFGEVVASRRLHSAQEVIGQVLGSIDNTLAVASLLARPEPIRRELTEVDTLLAIAIADMPVREHSRIRVERLADIRTVFIDMSLMRLALRNLLANALKFSADDAPVIIRLTDSDDLPALVIEVIDSGHGIAPHRLSRLFERGKPTEHERSSKREGLGLGLYIVRKVLELHDGRAELAANGPSGVTMRLVVCEPQEP